MSNTLTTSFSYSVNGFRQYAFAISPSSSPTPPSIVGSPSFYSVNASGATFSTSITVPSGSNRVLFIVATYYYGVATDSITFGGATMTKYYNGYGSLGIDHSIYYLVNPTASTDTILVTLDSNPGTILRTIGAFTTKDTNQITPINNNADIEGADTSTSVTCVPSVNHSLLFSSVSDYGFSGTVINTTDGTQAELWNQHTGGSNVTTSGSIKIADTWIETNVFDSLTSTENLQVANSQLNINIIDSLTSIEYLNVEEVNFYSVSDNLTVSDNATVVPPNVGFSPFLVEYLAITELAISDIPININVFEILVISEYAQPTNPAFIPMGVVTDSIQISELMVIEAFRFTTGRPQIGEKGISL